MTPCCVMNRCMSLGFLAQLRLSRFSPLRNAATGCQKNPHAMNYRFEISCLLVNSCSIYTCLIPVMKQISMFENVLKLCHLPIKSRSLATHDAHIHILELEVRRTTKNKGKLPANYYLYSMMNYRKNVNGCAFFRLFLLLFHLHGPWVANARRRFAVWFGLNIIAFYTSNKDLLDVSCVCWMCVYYYYFMVFTINRDRMESRFRFICYVYHIDLYIVLLYGNIQTTVHTSRPSQFHCTRSIYLL